MEEERDRDGGRERQKRGRERDREWDRKRERRQRKREEREIRLISGKGLKEKEQMNVIQTSFYKRLRTHSRKILKMEHDKIPFIRSSFY